MPKLKYISCFCVVVALAAWAPEVGITAETETMPSEDVQVLASGPIHEAFAEAVPLDPEPGINRFQGPPALSRRFPPVRSRKDTFNGFPVTGVG